MEYSRRSRGLAVEFAVLGYLVEAPSHGYELRERLKRGLGAFWRIASSHLYQVLHRLEEQGWVMCGAEAGPTGPSRTVYRATEQGISAFWDWAMSPVHHVRQIRVEFMAKVYFLRRLAPGSLARLVEGQTETLRRLEEHLSKRARLESDDDVLGTLAASYRRSQVRGTIRWLEENVAQLLGTKEAE